MRLAFALLLTAALPWLFLTIGTDAASTNMLGGCSYDSGKCGFSGCVNNFNVTQLWMSNAKNSECRPIRAPCTSPDGKQHCLGFVHCLTSGCDGLTAGGVCMYNGNNQYEGYRWFHACDLHRWCPVGQWQSGTPSKTKPYRRCSALTTCAADSYESAAPSSCPSPALPAAGSFWHVGSSSYDFSISTACSNRMCKALTSCDPATEYESTAATPTSDRVCTKLTAPCPTHGIPPARYVKLSNTASSVAVLREVRVFEDGNANPVPLAIASSTNVGSAVKCVDGLVDAETCTLQMSGALLLDLGSARTINRVTLAQTAFDLAGNEFSMHVAVSIMTTPTVEANRTEVVFAYDGQNNDWNSVLYEREMYESRPATATQDRVCSPTTACDLNTQWISQPATATSDRGCSLLTVCDSSTHWVSVEATSTSDRVCSPLTVCDPATQWILVAPTLTSDRICKPLTVCNLNATYESTAPTATSDRVCSALTTCSPNGLPFVKRFRLVNDGIASIDLAEVHVFAAPNPNNAEEKVQLSGSAYVSGVSAIGAHCFDNDLSTECQLAPNRQLIVTLSEPQPVVKVQIHQWVAAADTATKSVALVLESAWQGHVLSQSTVEFPPFDGHTGLVTKTSLFTQETFEHHPPTPTQDRQCAYPTQCDPFKEYISQRVNATSDQVCTRITDCPEATHFYKPPGAGMYNDLICQLKTVCNLTTQYIEFDGAKDHDRECFSLTTCDQETEYESEPPTKYSNRRCAPLTVCDLTSQYIIAEPTSTTDRACADLTNMCDPTTSFEAAEPTKYSDRLCTPLTPVCPFTSLPLARWLVLRSLQATELTIAEVDAVSSGVHRAPGMVVVARDYGGEAHNCIDGNTSTTCTIPGEGYSLVLDLGRELPLEEVKLTGADGAMLRVELVAAAGNIVDSTPIQLQDQGGATVVPYAAMPYCEQRPASATQDRQCGPCDAGGTSNSRRQVQQSVGTGASPMTFATASTASSFSYIGYFAVALVGGLLGRWSRRTVPATPLHPCIVTTAPEDVL